MITVIAHYRTRSEAADTAGEVLPCHSEASRAEEGCRQFDAHQVSEDPSRFALIEVYDSPAAFSSHRETEHFHTNIEGTLAPLLIERRWQTFGEPL